MKFLQRSIKSLGGCTTAITMLFIGTLLADAGLHNLLSRMTILFSVVRLVLIPLAVAAGCYLFHIGGTVAGLCVVLAAMSAGSTTAILAAKYHGDEVFATQCVVVTTVLSMIMLPFWCLVLNRLFSDAAADGGDASAFLRPFRGPPFHFAEKPEM